MRPVGIFQLVGKNIGTSLTEILVDTNPDEKWLPTFARGLAAFSAREFTAAKDFFDETISARGGDGPSTFYLDQIESFLSDPPDEKWQGEIRVTSK